MTTMRVSRLWARTSELGEKLSVAVAASLALVLLIWLVTPAHKSGAATNVLGESLGMTAPNGAAAAPGTGATVPGASGSLAAGITSGGATGSSAGTTTSKVGTSGAATGVGGAATAGSAANCVSPPGTDQGITTGSIKVAVIVLSIAGPVGNSTYGVDSPDAQKAAWQKVIDAINASGGVACRKVLPVYFEGNPADSSNLQQLCLDIAQVKPFFLFEGGAYGYIYPSLASCYVQNHIPFMSQTFSTAATEASWYPYAFFEGQRNLAYRNMIFALKGRGWFSASSGFKKLGVAYQNCDKQIPGQFFAWLHQAGLQDSQISSFDLGCSALFSPPSTMEQAILQFQRDGVTNVTFANDGNDWAPFTKIAEQQHFRPKYGITDDEAQVGVTYSNNAPDHNNIAGAIDIDPTASGEEHTAGMAPNAATVSCLALFGIKLKYPVSSYSEMIRASSRGSDCAYMWQFKAMVDSAPALQRTALAAGLQAARGIARPYPLGPADWNGPDTTWAGQYWRVNEFFTSCECWRLIDRTWHPSQ